jgi:uncharacterized protein (TIGR02118 family)
MSRLSSVVTLGLVAVAACAKSGEKAAAAADSTKAAPAAAPAPAPPPERAIVTVIYQQPKDAKTFEKYYAATHLPLVVKDQPEIGFNRADLTKFASNLDGKPASFYRQAELYFPSLDELKKGTATPGFKAVGDDLPKFATGGLVAMIGVETSPATEASTAAPMAVVTVLYKEPKDTAAFEKYYAETHLPLVGANQQEIGFVKAELTKFVSNLDGSPRTFYRQAELYFNSMDDLKKGIATPGFKKVSDDLGNFATGGLVGLIANETK